MNPLVLKEIGEFVASFFDIIQELSKLDNVSDEQKLAALTKEVVEAFEELDDVAVAALPLGWQPIAKLVIDNPATDTTEAEAVAKPVAEGIYRIWKAVKNFLG